MDKLYQHRFLLAEFEFVEYLSMFTFHLIMNYNAKINIGYTLMVTIVCNIYVQPLHRDFPFSHEKRETNRVIKLVSTVYNEKVMYVKLSY